jgi:hypothetical protein
MGRVTYTLATLAHADHVAEHMRVADRDEVWAVGKLGPHVSTRVSVRASSAPVAALWDGVPVAVFGVVPVNTIDGVGAPWLLGTDLLDKLAREWMTDAPQWIALLADGYSLLRNYVDARNVRSKVWLRRMGFKLLPPEPYGVAGLAFHQFERRV